MSDDGVVEEEEGEDASLKRERTRCGYAQRQRIRLKYYIRKFVKHTNNDTEKLLKWQDKMIRAYRKMIIIDSNYSPPYESNLDTPYWDECTQPMDMDEVPATVNPKNFLFWYGTFHKECILHKVEYPNNCEDEECMRCTCTCHFNC